jgi:2-polyprenyl-3-methyl-5-hydroxy-6-metoxy-1,4-benzoquinol methylase
VNHQQQVDRHFDEIAQHWKDLYQEQSVEGVIHQHRRSLALQWIQQLNLKDGARVLEVGCGAGLVAIELARAGYDVDCIDSSSAMVELAAAEAKEADMSGRLRVDVGDVHSLGFDASSFDLVIALGVVPFLSAPGQALAEMARVTRPGGSVLFTSDNKYRLNSLLDPRFVPFPGRDAIRRFLTRSGARSASKLTPKRFSYRGMQRMADRIGLRVERSAPIGYAPYTILNWELLAEHRSVRLNNWLQARADRGVPGLRAVAQQYLLLARRSR